MKTKTILIAGVVALAAMTQAACGRAVEPGNAGVKIKTLGTGAGVQPAPLGSGWHFTGIGEKIVDYPIIERRYSYTKESNSDGKENEELVFVDKNGLRVSGDMNIGIRVRQSAAPALYIKYRATLDQLLENQIRNDVRSAVARYAALMPVEQMLGGGHQVIATRAFTEVKESWARDGVDITRLEWSGSLRFPESVTASILARAQADQQVLAAQAQVAVAEAQAQEKVAIAKGDAEAYALRSRELSPAILQQQAIAKWDGKLPQVTGSAATPFINLQR
jgi:regulator of protease activity HflC (stomatin/prohibitin superfamily)